MKINHSSQQFPYNSQAPSHKKINQTQIPSNFSTYLLEDYTFLNEYQLLDSPINTETQFLAKINATQQLVKFIKKPFIPANTSKGLNMYKRFQAMFLLFQKGLILADNMFILEQGNNTYFYYIIEPYLKSSQSQIDMPFVTLQQYLFENRQNIKGFESKKTLLIKCKNLIDNLFQTGQSYCGLNTRSIVVDNEDNLFLLPYSLEFAISSKPYQRSYYPIEVLKHLQTNISKEPLKCLQKWDIWSFGCISIEIFLYLTPYFMSTSVQSQIKRISKETNQIFADFKQQFMDGIKDQISAYSESQCSINDKFEVQIEQMKKIVNFLANVFDLDQSKRRVSFETSERLSEISNGDSRKTVRLIKRYQRTKCQMDLKDIHRISKFQSTSINLKARFPLSEQRPIEQTEKAEQNFNELNICHKNQGKTISSEEKYQFEIRFKSFTIFDYKKDFNSQMQLLVEFSNSQRFKFFIDLPKDQDQGSSFQIQVNKKITISNKPFHYIENLIGEDVLVTVNFNDSKSLKNQNSLIFINLSALTLQSEESLMIWKKPIKGTYASERNDPINCKVKIEARLSDLVEVKAQLEAIQRQRTTTSKKSSVIGYFDSVSKNDILKEQIKIEDGQQTSRFRQPLGEKITTNNSENKQSLKNQKPIKGRDLSAKIKKLLMR